MSRRKISVVTPTLNRHKVMPGYLRTLTQQTVLPDEIVLVDAGESCEEIAKQALADSPIELVYLRSRRGTSVQRNVGIEAARGDILFFLDDDDLLQPTFIEHVVAAFDFQADPPVGAVAGVVEGAVNGSRLERLFRRVFRMGGATENGTAKVQDNAQVWWVLDPDRIREVPVVGTGHSAYLREAIGDERFDDFLPGYTFGEDVELAIRVAKRWTMVVTPHARLTHLYASANRVGEGERVGRSLYGVYYRYKLHFPHTPRSAASLMASFVGNSIMHGVRGVKLGQPVDMARGIAWGWTLIAKDLAGSPPER